uniref:Uncharacterized protein n=1 Tax=Palpitomonas bilix TaxID=652834 RepID=A0A7S3GBS4_9EUKA|mmetsp:Transcript_38056/g.98254  ORF Transcript_38056/g.98254 Transcript_38056/m.98254 type:complete len:242 (+) Transcript_38056:301-1026(+)|eukprot:CAMPEP_0113886874 /NCGR_PEP_ID=MMETSP0780_2-20120614/11836_1 /TAXON_ID=652834 /ORGANISM="Palpitomonas bilix" /LENGTH=241 /DNA_ID=CAMNT_0000875215 /DNA_START=301 /DNA_END=1026 /DNA_ORIENTATION=- /assembly_acc=CAM_ASM_000599
MSYVGNLSSEKQEHIEQGRIRKEKQCNEEEGEAFPGLLGTIEAEAQEPGPASSVSLAPPAPSGGKLARKYVIDPCTPSEAFRLLASQFDEDPVAAFRDGSACFIQFCLAALLEFLVRESYSIKKRTPVDTYGSKELIDAVILEVRKLGKSPLAIALVFKSDYIWKRWIRRSLRVIPEFFEVQGRKIRDELFFDVEVKPMFELQSTPLSEQSKKILEFIQQRVEECKTIRATGKGNSETGKP